MISFDSNQSLSLWCWPTSQPALLPSVRPAVPSHPHLPTPTLHHVSQKWQRRHVQSRSLRQWWGRLCLWDGRRAWSSLRCWWRAWLSRDEEVRKEDEITSYTSDSLLPARLVVQTTVFGKISALTGSRGSRPAELWRPRFKRVSAEVAGDWRQGKKQGHFLKKWLIVEQQHCWLVFQFQIAHHPCFPKVSL